MTIELACFDLEGVFVPEIWINVAERTGISDLRLTTRDVADYDELMGHRLRVLDEHGLRLSDITRVIAALEPLPGAAATLDWVRENFAGVIILSDTFTQFAKPLMAHLGWPALFCHELEIGPDDRITGWRLRQPNQKYEAVRALQGLGFRVLAAGDSYNDTAMLEAADAGILFDPPANVIAEFPHLPVASDYAALRRELALASVNGVAA
jgi:phosphoserine/homoserine phosphotransferase